MNVAIVTGESKGLGKSIATSFLQRRIHVIGISRTGSKELTTIAEKNDVTYEHYSCDLSDTSITEEIIFKISESIFKQKISNLYVVNNAGVLKPIDQAMNTSGADVAYHVHVNTIAPMIIMNALLKRGTTENVPVIGATITSGAAERPIYGWSAYCSTKASINMYTETVALEQDMQKTGNKVIAFSPGIMDTAMQEQIRATKPSEFDQVEQFRDYKKNDLLLDPNLVGEILVNIMTSDGNIRSGEVYYVNEFL